MSNVKVLWYASTDFRATGKWKPKQPFYLEPGTDKKPATPKNCHVLYATPLEALLSLREELSNKFSWGTGTAFVQMYKVKLIVQADKHLLTPEQVEPYGFFDDFDLLPRYLCKTYQLFERIAWLKIKGPRYSKEPYDLWWKRVDEPDSAAKLVMPMVTIEPEHRFFEWSRLPEKDVIEKHFNFLEHNWNCDITLLPHDPKLLERKRGRSNTLGQQGQTVGADPETDIEVQEGSDVSGAVNNE